MSKRSLIIVICILLVGILGGYSLLRGSSASTIDGDVNNDSVVNTTDLSILLSNFGKAATNLPLGDINGDGKIDVQDLSFLLSNFGKTGSATPQLRWSPPVGYENYNVINIGASADSQSTFVLDDNKDYLVKFPKGVIKHGGVQFKGGHNIVIIGGHSVNDVSLDLSTQAGIQIFLDPSLVNRGLYFFDSDNATQRERTIYIEGFLYEGSVNTDDPTLKTDGVDIRSPKATLIIQNSRFINLRGSPKSYYRYKDSPTPTQLISDNTPGFSKSWDGSTNRYYLNGRELVFLKNEHSDMIQPFGGVKNLFIDRFTGTTNCQGFFLPPDKGPIGAIDISNTNLTFQNIAPGCSELLWLTKTISNGAPCQAGNPITFKNVYLDPGTRTFESVIWPKTNRAETTRCPATITNNTTATWNTGDLRVNGFVTKGQPPTGDYVPKNTVGENYTRP